MRAIIRGGGERQSEFAQFTIAVFVHDSKEGVDSKRLYIADHFQVRHHRYILCRIFYILRYGAISYRRNHAVLGNPICMVKDCHLKAVDFFDNKKDLVRGGDFPLCLRRVGSVQKGVCLR